MRRGVPPGRLVSFAHPYLPHVFTSLAPWIDALPWIVLPILVIARASRSRSLDDEPATVPAGAPSVSVVVPARDEARNIGRCVEALRASHYPALEIVVVDDHSTDGTGEIARAHAAADSRVRVLVPDALPDGWMGKQWACASGARVATGSLLCFLDADTFVAPDLVPRTVNAIASRRADLLSVASWQELGSFWERVVQPHIFSTLLARYGSTESVSGARHHRDVIANGQCLWVQRAAYEAIGGHAAVRDLVAEDLALAQRFHRDGRRVALVLGLRQLTTRMYTSLPELVRGWGKNVYAGGIHAVPFGVVGRILFPLLLPLVPLLTLWPVVTLLAALLGWPMSPTRVHWASIATVASLLYWLAVYRWLRLSPLYALTYPLGALVQLWISLAAMVRGRRVEWKGRAYRSA